MNKQRVGKKGEELARDVAMGQGYSIIQSNFRCPLGEIDLILRKEDVVVFLEVKTRRGNQYGEPWESVTSAKQERIKRVATWFVSRQGYADISYRFDVFTIKLDRKPWQYRWFKGAF